ncbi:MAG: hypothetical protein LPK25_14445 [Cyclobacteriaceae bacterium]|nr:hypothetical protein [Cyclobacteriaceae bacterium]
MGIDVLGKFLRIHEAKERMNITRNITSLREATAIALVQLSQEATLLALKENRYPKGMFGRLRELPAPLQAKKLPNFFHLALQNRLNLSR